MGHSQSTVQEQFAKQLRSYDIWPAALQGTRLPPPRLASLLQDLEEVVHLQRAILLHASAVDAR